MIKWSTDLTDKTAAVGSYHRTVLVEGFARSLAKWQQLQSLELVVEDQQAAEKLLSLMSTRVRQPLQLRLVLAITGQNIVSLLSGLPSGTGDCSFKISCQAPDVGVPF